MILNNLKTININCSNKGDGLVVQQNRHKMTGLSVKFSYCYSITVKIFHLSLFYQKIRMLQ